MAKNIRTIDPNALISPHDSDSLAFNYQSGGKKNLTIGPHLIPIRTSSGWTTDVSGSAVGLPKSGMNIAVYNSNAAVQTVTIGDSSGLASQAIGAVDASGNAGVPCPPGAWTYLSMGANKWIISSDTTVKVFLVDDSTYISSTN